MSLPEHFNGANVTRIRLVQCPACRKAQPDPGRQRATCPYCGTQPLPSYEYPQGSSFRPRPMERHTSFK